MLFSSYIFLFGFLPVTLAGFCLLSRRAGPKAAKIWLSLASLFFYGWWNPAYVALILLSMGFNFQMGRRLGTAAREGRAHRGMLASGVGANLLLLGYYKYAGFFVANVNAALGVHWTIPAIVLPLGISFFTFTQIAYLIDASRGLACEYDPGDYLLFITFFPHLIAGPIIHHREMMPQFAEPKTYRFDWNNLALGLQIFAVGLFKKVGLADNLSDDANRVFNSAHRALYATDAWQAALDYAFQIYFDFSGYSDMAIGLARMFGITLPLNFDSPYRAVNLIDFWRRWHMTFSRFLRDYLYIPLGGNRRGPGRRYLNLVVTMALGGLWHGAAWTYVLWGLYHGVCLALNQLARSLWPRPGSAGLSPAWLTPWTGRVVTLFLVVVGWVLFRAGDLDAVGHMLGAMFGWGTPPAAGAPPILRWTHRFWFIGLFFIVWALPNTARLSDAYHPYSGSSGEPAPGQEWWARWRLSPAWACVVAALLAASVLSLQNASEFLYYNF